jgi:TonB family protein
VVLLALIALSALAQDWTPSRIVSSDYPALSRAARIQGTVEVKCTLDSNGNVIAAESLTGPLKLREAARRNALQWKFQRTSKDVRDNFATLSYSFQLEGKPQDRKSATFIF